MTSGQKAVFLLTGLFAVIAWAIIGYGLIYAIGETVETVAQYKTERRQ